MGIGGAVSGTHTPIFGLLNSTQEGHGLGNVCLTAYDDNTIYTYKNVLDDGSGNTVISGTLLSKLAVSNSSTAGNITATAAQLSNGYFADGATQTADFTITTDTATNIYAELPRAIVGTSFKFRFLNNDQSSTGYSATLVAGTGVTISNTLPNPAIAKGSWADFLFTFTSVGSSPAITVNYIGQGVI
jgi:hypothetical protein